MEENNIYVDNGNTKYELLIGEMHPVRYGLPIIEIHPVKYELPIREMYPVKFLTNKHKECFFI